MTGLNWFQARDLGEVGYAIRRIGWDFWLIYRLNVWLRVSYVDGAEVLSVVKATEFGANEFLAKDYTLLPGENMTTPPCARQDLPKETLPRRSSQTFTLTKFCGGYGGGGNVLPIGGPGITEPEIPEVLVTVVANGDAMAYEPLMPDGAGCWTVAPATFYLLVGATVGEADIFGVYFQWSTAGASLAGDLAWMEAHPNATGDAVDPGGYSFGAQPFGDNWFAVQGPALAFVAGATITARADILLTNGTLLTGFGEMTQAALCP